MSRDRPSFVIVGGGVAAGSALSTLRAQGFDGRLVLIGAEAHRPYERPPLSKAYLRGETPFEEAHLPPLEWYESNEVDLRLGAPAVALDPAARTVTIVGGEIVAYDRLLLATGARNRRLRVPGGGLEGVYHLRSVEDCDRIRQACDGGDRVAVVGAGFIGMEVAASLRRIGKHVEVLDIFRTPLERVLGPEVGRAVQVFHRDEGVVFHLGQTVERFEGAGRVERVVTSAGDVIECDFVAVGVGVEPNVELARRAGLAVADGVLVDSACRTEVPEVFAAGDVANHDHPIFGRIRVEHWDNAVRQGRAVAEAMLGRDVVFDDLHWFWSDQYDHSVQYTGFARTWDDLVFRGGPREGSFVAFYLEGGVVRGVAGLDRGRDVRRSAGLVRAVRPVDPARLADEGVDLKALGTELLAGADGERDDRRRSR